METANKSQLDNPPLIQNFDKTIGSFNGTTSALELQTAALQASKHVRRPTNEQCVVDLIRRISALRRELRFFRLEYEASQALVGKIYDISHQMYLHYFAHEADAQLHQEWFDQAQKIDQHLQDYADVVSDAEVEWIELGRRQVERDKRRWI
jgi:hypothetical protein